jgi:SAM-dependent methyltransferase
MIEKEWFINWFDSSYYHLLYKNRDDNEAEHFIKNLVNTLKIPQGSKILDVACGRGRHAKILRLLGFDVTGIDLSENSIRYARQFEDERLHFHLWDMRKIFKKEYFDVVLNLFSSFGYLPDYKQDLDALQAMGNNLRPPGFFILDYFNAEWVVKNLKTREIIPRDDIHFHIQKKVENGCVIKKIEFLDENGTHHAFEEKLRIIHLQNFEELFSKAGLKLKNVWGDYSLNSFQSSSSPRMILCATKE